MLVGTKKHLRLEKGEVQLKMISIKVVWYRWYVYPNLFTHYKNVTVKRIFYEYLLSLDLL